MNPTVSSAEIREATGLSQKTQPAGTRAAISRCPRSDSTQAGHEFEQRESGRPSMLDPITIESICKGIRIGLTNRDAAMRAGISEATFYSWMQKARKSGAAVAYVQFLESLAPAEPPSATNARCHARTLRPEARANVGTRARDRLFWLQRSESAASARTAEGGSPCTDVRSTRQNPPAAFAASLGRYSGLSFPSSSR